MGCYDNVKTLGATDMGVFTLFWLFLQEIHQRLAGVIMENPEKGFLWLWLSQGNSNRCSLDPGSLSSLWNKSIDTLVHISTIYCIGSWVGTLGTKGEVRRVEKTSYLYERGWRAC